MIVLTRIDAARNMRRFYAVDVTPTLFGEWQLVRDMWLTGFDAPPPFVPRLFELLYVIY